MEEGATHRHGVLKRVARHPVLVVLVAATILSVVVAVAAPESLQRWTGVEEGPIEHLSHLLLLAAAILWVIVAVRARTGLSIATACYVVLLMFEEIDWGAVYGVDLGHSLLADLLGIPALHHSQWRAGAVWEDKLFWFAIPVLAFFALPLVLARRKILERLAPIAPRPEEGVLFILVLGTYELIDAVIPKLMSIYQGVTFVLIAAVGWRVLGDLRAQR